MYNIKNNNKKLSIIFFFFEEFYESIKNDNNKTQKCFKLNIQITNYCTIIVIAK